MYLITAKLFGMKYFYRQLSRNAFTWEGLIQNATRFKTEYEAETEALFIKDLSVEIEKIAEARKGRRILG